MLYNSSILYFCCCSFVFRENHVVWHNHSNNFDVVVLCEGRIILHTSSVITFLFFFLCFCVCFFYDQRELFCFSPSLLCPWCCCYVLWKKLGFHLFYFVLRVVALSCPSCCCFVIRENHVAWNYHSCVLDFIVPY